MAKEIEQFVYMPELDKDGKKAVLVLSTMKSSSGGLASCASISFHSNSNGMNCRECELFGDFRAYPFRDKTTRATQKAIDSQHKAVFTTEAVEVLKAQVMDFYAKKLILA